MTDQYIEVDGHPVPEPDQRVWARWRRATSRQVALDKIGPASVRTRFLGLNYALPGELPLLYETLAIGPFPDIMERYATREAAVAGHANTVDYVRSFMRQWEAHPEKRVTCPHCSREFLP